MYSILVGGIFTLGPRHSIERLDTLTQGQILLNVTSCDYDLQVYSVVYLTLFTQGVHLDVKGRQSMLGSKICNVEQMLTATLRQSFCVKVQH